MKIAIVEDELIVVEDLSRQLSNMGYEVVAKFSAGEPLIAYVKNHEIDLILVDINLNGELNGIETLRKLNGMVEIPSIFITAQSDEETFRSAKEVKPMAYLVKPYNSFDLKAAIELAIENFNELRTSNQYIIDDTIYVRGKNRFERINLSDILFLEASGNYTEIHTKLSKYVITSKLGDLEQHLEEKYFFRCHRSFIVNIREMEGFDDSGIYIKERKIPLSRALRKTFMERLRVI